MRERGMEFLRLQFVTVKRAEAQPDRIVWGVVEASESPVLSIRQQTIAAAISSYGARGVVGATLLGRADGRRRVCQPLDGGAIPNEWICAAKFAASLPALEGGAIPLSMRLAKTNVRTSSEGLFIATIDPAPIMSW